ncbi:hypothetical protein ACJX0J_013806, partial [Zea mays]
MKQNIGRDGGVKGVGEDFGEDEDLFLVFATLSLPRYAEDLWSGIMYIYVYECTSRGRIYNEFVGLDITNNNENGGSM